MDKQAKWHANAQGRHTYSGYTGWQDYSDYSGYSEKSYRPQRKPQDPHPGVFPSFEMMATTGPKSGHAGARGVEAGSGIGKGDFVKSVQKLVNNVRRSEQRLRKQEEEKEQIDKKWDLYQKELKASFMAERARHRGMMDKIQQEKEDAQRCHETAIEELYTLLADPTAYLTKPVEPEPTLEAQAEWDKLMAGPEEDDDMGLSSLLAGAVRGGQPREQARKRLLAALESRRKVARARTPRAKHRLCCL